jgi:molybdopterin-guanine dinucleotide biosynthesis protein A
MNTHNIDALMLMGRSVRVENKPFIMVGGRELFSYGYDILDEIFARVFIVCEKSLEGRLRSYSGLNVVSEGYGIGPLGGIYEGARHSSADFIFVTGCDMPLLNKRVLGFLSSLVEGDGVVVVNEKGFYEPLHSIYLREKVLKVLERTLKKEQRISWMIERMDLRRVSTEELRELDAGLMTFRNVNTLEDIAWFEEFLSRQ